MGTHEGRYFDGRCTEHRKARHCLACLCDTCHHHLRDLSALQPFCVRASEAVTLFGF